MIPYSVLDLSPVPAGSTPAQALANTVDLARHTEALGYHRYWMAEHHNMTGIASAATSILIGHVAGATSTIRVGAGGIMLPNHAPLVIAEQFGTLATLYPDRIDLGLGRAPGTDQLTMRALRRGEQSADMFPQDVVELMGYFEPAQPGQKVRAVPGAGTHVPVWILGSSLFGAQLAAHLGLPYAFASHFAPDALEQAVEIYRARFNPGATEKPCFMSRLTFKKTQSYLSSSVGCGFVALSESDNAFQTVMASWNVFSAAVTSFIHAVSARSSFSRSTMYTRDSSSTALGQSSSLFACRLL